MPSLITATIDEMRGYTVVQIQNALNNKINGMSKKQLILLVLALQDAYDEAADPDIADQTQFAYHPNGQWRSSLSVRRDALGVKRGSSGTVRTFTDDTSVDTITTIDYDGADKPVKRVTITYHHDGRQPEMKVESPVVEMPMLRIKG